MTKGILEFDLATEKEEFEEAQKAGKYLLIIDEIRMKLRSELKYAEEPMSLREFSDWLYNETDISKLLEE